MRTFNVKNFDLAAIALENALGIVEEALDTQECHAGKTSRQERRQRNQRCDRRHQTRLSNKESRWN